MTAFDLRAQLDEYLALKEALGFELENEPSMLAEFLEYLEMWDLAPPLTAKMAVDWACAPCGRPYPPRNACSAEPGRRLVARRLTVVRLFLAHLKASFPDTEIPDRGLVAADRRPKPYIFTDDEVTRLMEAARQLPPMGWPLRPHTYGTLIGLLASTGLRIGEARKLAIEDVRLDATPPQLVIRETKFHKTRLVPVHPETATMLGDYAERRCRFAPTCPLAPYFIYKGRGLGYEALHSSFAKLLRRARIYPVGERRPTWHSLRHSFAVKRLVAWEREGLDVREQLPHLSVYMGHVEIANTYWYLTATADLLMGAGESFERFAKAGRAGA